MHGSDQRSTHLYECFNRLMQGHRLWEVELHSIYFESNKMHRHGIVFLVQLHHQPSHVKLTYSGGLTYVIARLHGIVGLRGLQHNAPNSCCTGPRSRLAGYRSGNEQRSRGQQKDSNTQPSQSTVHSFHTQ